MRASTTFLLFLKPQCWCILELISSRKSSNLYLNQRIVNVYNDLTVASSFFTGISVSTGGAIYGTSSMVDHQNAWVLWMQCLFTRWRHQQENGAILLLNLCFERWATTKGINGDISYCVLINHSNGTLLQCTSCKWGFNMTNMEKLRLVLSFSCRVNGLNTTFSAGYRTPGVIYRCNIGSSEETLTVYESGSGEMGDELSYGSGIYSYYGVVNCSVHWSISILFFRDGEVSLISCCCFDNSYDEWIKYRAPTVVNCLAFQSLQDMMCVVWEICAHPSLDT